jgi:PAS domain S-box-containing protein
MTSHIHALMIEDDPDDVLLLKDCLAKIGAGTIKLDHTDRLSKALIQLAEQSYDVILLDLNLPDSRGLETINYTIKRFPKIPVVVLSGLADEAITIEAVRRGAQDYLVKGEISGPLVMRVMRYAIERKQIEAILRTNEARYRTLVETSPNGITLTDLEGNLLLCNQQAAQLHGYEKPEAMLGLHLFKLYAPEDRQQAVTNTQKTLNEGRVINAECTLRRKDGSQFPAEISTVLIRNTGGTPTGFFSIAQDITDRKQAIESEKQYVMLKEDLISRVSHELRSPLLSLMGYLDLLRNGKVNDPDKWNEFLTRASKDAHRLLDLGDELSDFSLAEKERLTLDWEKADLIKLITDVLQSLRDEANVRRISLSFAPMNPSLEADVDPARMRRVMVKLVENAIKSSKADGKVFVTGKSMNGNIIINVIDEGSGISVEECSKIFNKYYHAEYSTQNNSNGMGFGLYIAKRIVEAHRGTLTVGSQLGAGTTFSIKIPANKRTESVAV